MKKTRSTLKKYGVRQKTYDRLTRKYQNVRRRALRRYYKGLIIAREFSGDYTRAYKPFSFQYRTLRDVLTKGVKVYRHGKFIKTLKGKKAVEYRIRQFERNISQRKTHDTWINNYLAGLRNIGMPSNLIRLVRDKFRSIDPNYLDYLIATNNIPSFSFIYDGEDAQRKYLQLIDMLDEMTKYIPTQRRFRVAQEQLLTMSYKEWNKAISYVRKLERASRGQSWRPF